MNFLLAIKSFLALALLLQVCLHAVNAHYSVARLVVNGTISRDWQYVRQQNITNINYPYYDIESPDLRCGDGATTTGPGTQTATVLAGDTVGFMVSNTTRNDQDGFYHAGDALAYMSHAPGDDIESYKGDGDWFKIGQYGILNATEWKCDNYQCLILNFTIPKTTPPGKYLLRAEQLYMQVWGVQETTGKSSVQLYIGCAHIQVIGNGGGTPGPLVKFPGLYSTQQPQFNPPKRWADITRHLADPEQAKEFNIEDYTSPGPAVWYG